MDFVRLLSPPESKPQDSFSPSRRPFTPIGSSQSASFGPENTLPPISSSRTKDVMGRLPSPPVTPGTLALQRIDKAYTDQEREDVLLDHGEVHDPILFPSNESRNTVSADHALFPSIESSQDEKVDSKLDAIVRRHMATHMSQFRHAVNKPTREEYLLALSCVPIVSEKYVKNPRKWLQQERRILDERFGGANRVWKRPTGQSFAKLAPAPTTGVKRSNVVNRQSRQSRALPRTPKRTPQAKALDSFDSTSSTPKRVIGMSREDTDFASLPDYSPPLSTLPSNNPKILKADWKGHYMDLSDDPHRHLLSDAEVNLAGTLRLSCATYLCSKRRIFSARLEAFRRGKEFRKTDSQQACKIDVNKASKLWTAYDRVGWFSPEHFRHLL
ncbi:MAG: hypothetical protein M1833_006171 [Piccolia ochrophora]|nr:MAG: hypothetical protein M1833_006171 [Piccolia ochrophora]